MPDNAGHDATAADTRYSLSVDEVATMYARAGHPRTLRTIQRYCASGHLECVKETTMLGDKYFIEPTSVARHIGQIEELIALDARAHSRDASRLVATVVAPEIQVQSNAADATRRDVTPPVAAASVGDDKARLEPTEPAPVSRPAATAADASRYVAGLEREVEHALEDREFLREQIKTKDKQIDALLERDRETNILVRGLQQMLSPLLGGPRREPPEEGSRSGF